MPQPSSHNYDIHLAARSALREAFNLCQPDAPGRVREALLSGAHPDENPFESPVRHGEPLAWAVRRRQADVVGMLLEAGADPDAPLAGGDERDPMTARRIAAGMARDAVIYKIPTASPSIDIAELFDPEGLARWSARQPWMPQFRQAMALGRERLAELSFGPEAIAREDAMLRAAAASAGKRSRRAPGVGLSR